MLKVMRWVGYAFGIVLLLIVGLWVAARLLGPSSAQERALAMMEQPWQPQGRNAFAAFWLLTYDVPEAEQAAIVAEDARRLDAMLSDDGGIGAGMDFESSAEGRYPDLLPSSEDRAMFCVTGADCYRKVADDLDAYQALVQRNEMLLARIDRLSDHDHYKSVFPQHIDSPIPMAGFDSGALRLTQHAVQFASGDQHGALDRVCRDIGTWRQLGANSDSIITRMVGIRNSTDRHGQLLAELVQSMPPGVALPQSCAVALSPMSAEELSMCRPMQGEFLLASSAMAMHMDTAEDSWSRGVESALFYSVDMTKAAIADRFGTTCAPEVLQQIADDVAAEPYVPNAMPWWQCAGNIYGCILGRIPQPAYADYVHRAQDQAARVQLLATLLWLRDSGGQESGMPMVERLALRPAELKSPTRDIEVSEDGRAIRIRQFDTSRGDYWQVPLPEYFQPGLRG